MLSYPGTMLDFSDRFPTEGSCRSYLESLRWPEGFVCPRCQWSQSWLSGRDLRICGSCGYQASVLAGTIFQDTHLPMRTWFQAAWWLTHQKTGASALGLQRSLGLGSYRTAWMMLHKLRAAMVRPGREPLDGTVEVDETFLGGPKPGKRGRGAAGKTLVVIAAEVDGNKTGRIRMQSVSNASATTLNQFIKAHVASKSKIITDGWRGYSPLKKNGYRHQCIPGNSVGDDVLLPRAHRVASLLKRWLLGTLHGRIGRQHLDAYLNEFTFRFNRRTSGARGLLFFRLLQHATAIQPYTYQHITQTKNHN